MTSGRKILLVDDDAAFADATALILKQAGYDTLTAQSGKEGLAVAREHRPDLMILDVMMGRPDEGFAVARVIASDPDLAGMKVLLLSAVGERYDMFFEPDDNLLPVDKVLEKPVDADELLKTIEGLLDRAGGDAEEST